MPAIMYVCDQCAEDAPESCGHYERDRLRVIPEAGWLCEGCYDEFEFGDLRDLNEHRPPWNDFPIPPEYVPAR